MYIVQYATVATCQSHYQIWPTVCRIIVIINCNSPTVGRTYVNTKTFVHTVKNLPFWSGKYTL